MFKEVARENAGACLVFEQVPHLQKQFELWALLKFETDAYLQPRFLPVKVDYAERLSGNGFFFSLSDPQTLQQTLP